MTDFELKFDVVSYTLLALLLGVLILPLFFQKEPDLHPYALLRQSTTSPVRNPKESVVHRSVHTPFGYPLVSGLGLPTDKRYASRNGDIRDIWKLAVEKGKGKLLSVKGVDIEEHDMNQLTHHIRTLGAHLKEIGAKRVAMYLPNDVENLVASFACAFYNITLIILPFDPEGCPELPRLLQRSPPDVLIAQAGQVPLDDLKNLNLKEVLYVVEPGSQHIDWQSPEGTNLKSELYHEVVNRSSDAIGEPEVDMDMPAVIIFGPRIEGKQTEIVEFTHKNIIAGVAAQTVVLPKSQTYKPEDIIAPVDSLSDLYTRIHTYAALAAGSTVCLNSVAGKGVDLQLAVKNVNPTVIIASPESLLKLYFKTRGSMIEIWHGIIHFFQTRTLTRSGRIPKGNLITRFNDYIRPDAGPNLRLLFVAESAGDPNSQALNSLDLSDLRVFFKCRVVYGLKHHKVAGPLTQWNIYDYRMQKPKQLPSRAKGIPRQCAHFGAVTPGIEMKLKDVQGYTAEDKEGPRGEVYVAGLPVAGGQAALGFVGKWEPEGVLSYA